MNVKAKLATILRRMADRLAPAPAGDCGSGATWINYSLDAPVGVSSLRVMSASRDQVFTNHEFESGEGWTPA